MEASPPIPVRIEWADSQGRVTASWLPAHFILLGLIGWDLARADPRRKVTTN
jgi:hypothetical protein